MSPNDEAGFNGWLRDVDRVLGGLVGLSHLDLPDALWRDWYDDEILPLDAARMFLEDEGMGGMV